jgi:hypothetical protein
MRRTREAVLAQRTAMKKNPSRGADFVVTGYSLLMDLTAHCGITKKRRLATDRLRS